MEQDDAEMQAWCLVGLCYLPDSLGNNALSVLYICKSQLAGNVCQRDAAVGQADSAKPCPDDIVAQPDNEIGCPVLSKHLVMGVCCLPAGTQESP